MEKLSQQEQEAVKKMSSDRLRLRLIAAGFDEDAVVQFDRPNLVSTYAELLATGKISPFPPTPVAAGYDPEIERQRLAFEQQKWKAEMEMKERQWGEEKQMKARQQQLEEEQLQLRKLELDREESRKDSPAAKGKLFGDAMRASAIRMGPDILDVIPFFKNVENLFQVYDVPRNLQPVLIRPFLNDKAKALMAQLDPAVTVEYRLLKEAMLREFQLSPAKYLERFNTYKRPETETYVMYASKLSALLDYYLESRHVDTFARLRELLICDRLKLSLSDACLRHVMSIESADKDRPWLPVDQLTRTVDTFLANHKSGNMPIAMSINQPTPRMGVQGTPPPRPILSTPFRPTPYRPFGSGGPPKFGNEGAVNSARRRCFICNTPGHLRAQCPKAQAQLGVRHVSASVRGSGGIGVVDQPAFNSQPQPTKQADVHRVSVYSSAADSAGGPSPGDAYATNKPILLPACTNSQASDGTTFTDEDRPMYNTDNVTTVPVDKMCVNNCMRNDYSTVGLCTANRVVNECNEYSIDVDGTNPISSNAVFSPLKRINVNVAVGLDDVNILDNVSAVCDSGAEVCVIRAELIDKSSPVPVGQVTLRPFWGQPMVADVVRLHISLTDGKPIRGIDVYAASVENANDDLLLTNDAVNRLMSCSCDVSRVVTRARSAAAKIETESESESVVFDDYVTSANVSDAQSTHVTVSNNDDVGADIVGDACNDNVDDGDAHIASSGNISCDDVLSADDLCTDDVSMATRAQLIDEQKNDPSLNSCWQLATKLRGGFLVKDGILFKRERWYGQPFLQLVAPTTRRKHILMMGHDTVGGHMSAKRSKQRISLSFWWPGLASDCKAYVKTCAVCQKKARVTYRDRVPIKAIPRADQVFDHFFIDCMGPIFSGEGPKPLYNYGVILVDSASRFPAAYAIRSLTAKNVCDAILKLWQFTGVSSFLSSDLGSNFTSELTREFERRLGCSPRFNSPYHPNSTGLAERGVGNVKTILAKVAADHPRRWHEYLPFIMWCLREVPNSTSGVPPWSLVFGHLPKGPLAILKDNWCGEHQPPISFGKSTTQYLNELHEKLEMARKYATEHCEREQKRYVAHYNLRAQDKHFEVGEQVLVLIPDSTNHVFAKWRGPCEVVDVRSPYSYTVELDGVRRHFHANKLRKFHVRVDAVICDSFLEDLETSSINTCAIIREADEDFGELSSIPHQIHEQKSVELPSSKIDLAAIAHLSEERQAELLQVLDRYPECFSETPGFTDVIEHEIDVPPEFKPKRLRAYRVPEKLKPEVDKEIQLMLNAGIIRPSRSPMASPLVCILKGPEGREGIRLAVDYRFVNKYTTGDALPLPDISSVFQRIGNAKFVTVADCKSGYWQLGVREKDKWLTAFVCDAGLFEFNRAPFGLKCSGNSFVRAVEIILRPVSQFAASFVDDMAVHSNYWKEHLYHLDRFLQTISDAGITLSLRKCKWALPQVKFCGEIIGSGKRYADPEKVKAVHDLKIPKTKTELRQILGFFSYFRQHVCDFAAIAKPLTDLTAKNVPGTIPWGEPQQQAFDTLKQALCKATVEPLYIIDFTKPFNLFVDASAFAVSSILTQTGPEGTELPVAFSSSKLTKTQSAWSTIEREAYAALLGLQKYRNWIFGSEVTVHSDHNPLLYLTESAPKSAKLMRWALALQEFSVTFKYRAGKSNAAADCLSRM